MALFGTQRDAKFMASINSFLQLLKSSSDSEDSLGVEDLDDDNDDFSEVLCKIDDIALLQVSCIPLRFISLLTGFINLLYL